jgi:glycine oxidase
VPGTTLRLDAGTSQAPGVVVRGTVQGRPVYAVPRPVRPDGRREVVVGATSDEREDDRLTRAGDVFGLLRDVRALLPELDDAVLLEAVTRSRPGSPDNAPLLGWAADGLFLATGHHRNGILLTPLTAAAVDRALGVAPAGAEAAAAVEAAARFADPRRFSDPQGFTDAYSTARGGTA